MCKEQKLPPHVATHDGEQGAHDVPVPQVVREGDGYHSGRMTPKPTPHRDLDKKVNQTSESDISDSDSD